MENSRKPPLPDPAVHVEQVLKKRVEPGRHLVLALSGGVDSVALLDILARLRGPFGFSLSALHVNHQISPNAGEWARFCAELCARLDVPLEVAKVVVPRAGESLEAAAREARYREFAKVRGDFVVLAQHRDDQAETLLLQLLRGAGVAGSAAMPELSGAFPRLLRPLLDIPRAALEAYAKANGLSWVEDESNLDTRFDRNFLRHRAFPVLAERFPACRTTFSRAARHFAEAAQLLDELAELDLRGALRDGGLAVESLRALSPVRAKNLLRYWLAGQGITPNTARLEEMLRQLTGARQGAQVRIPLGGLEIRRFQGFAHAVPVLLAPDPDFSRRWQGEEAVALPELGGALRFRRAQGEGISLARLEASAVTIRPRRGGERLQPDCRRPTRTLKNLLQEAQLPPWRREMLPLVWCGEELAVVPGIGVGCGFQAKPDEIGVVPEWGALS